VTDHRSIAEGVAAAMNSTTTNGALPARGPATNGANGNGPVPPAKRIVKKGAANPFGTARQPGQWKKPNGQPVPVRPNGTPPAAGAPQKQNRATPPTTNLNSNTYSGFTDPAVVSGGKKYTDYKLVATKKDLLEGLRYHVMQLSTDKSLDVRDPRQFSQPAHLHRRDPRAAPSGVKDDQVEFKDGMNAEEREQLREKNEARKAERAANLAMIAPAQATRKATNHKTKTKAVYKREYTEEDKRRIQTNYEEKLPWHLEDFDNKHCLVGENQAPSSHRHVAFVHEPAVDSQPARFRLIPLEKVYEFKPKKKDRKENTIEEAEAAMRKRVNMPEWLEAAERRPLERKKKEIEARSSKLYTGENKSNKHAGRTGEDVDWDNDDDGGLFADDEEGDHFAVKDEDEALAEKRVKEDHLKANFFDVKEEKEYDEEEAEEQKEEEQRKEQSRGYRKLLEKHEHNYNHASDSEYSSSVRTRDLQVAAY